jgi:cysteine desulfurase family protein
MEPSRVVDRPRIYLDNAATSWPKPVQVYDAVNDYQRRLGAALGRSGYAEADEVDRRVEATRAAVAQLIDAESSDRIIFTFNGTDSLNLAIHGVLKPGDHVVTSVVEHNSVLRPLRWLEDRGQIVVTRVGCSSSGLIDPDDIRSSLRLETKLIVLTHASNVVGTIQPASEVGKIARESGVLFLLDAAQTLGHLPVSVQELGADFLAAPGHKGLLGPLGTGLLYIRPGLEATVDCIKQGGTGSSSSDDRQPRSPPEKYEPGNHNVPGLLGLQAGLEHLKDRGLDVVRQHTRTLTDLLLQGLIDIPGVTVFGPRDSAKQTGVVSIALDGIDAVQAAALLDKKHGVQVRAGFQCAALLHRYLGTIDKGGTIRLSIGPFSTTGDINSAVDAIRRVRQDGSARKVKCPCVDGRAEAANPSDPSGLLRANIGEDACDRFALGGRISGLDDLWNLTSGDPEITIAVLDGPVDFSHPSLATANFTSLGPIRKATIQDGTASRHGTQVTSIIFGQHNSSVSGIAPNCGGLLGLIFLDGPDGSLRTASQGDLAEAIREALRSGANIINISAGEPEPSGEASPDLLKAIEECEAEGVLVVAAAGNGGCPGLGACECVHVPGAISSVLAVGAMGDDGRPLAFSNCGPQYLTQGILALGENIRGAVPGGQTEVSTGTSFATPIVAGIAALLMSLQRSRGQAVDSFAVRKALLESAQRCDETGESDCQRLLVGRLNLTRAIQILFQGDHVMSSESSCKAAPLGLSDTDTSGGTKPSLSTPLQAGDPSTEFSQMGHTNIGRVASGQGTFSETCGMLPSACSPQQPSPFAYVIGDLGFDFGTHANRGSILVNWRNGEIRDASGKLISVLDIDSSLGILAYLLGFRVRRNPKAGKDKPGEGDKFKPIEFCGNLNDAKCINWTLLHDDCPKYVVKPQGEFAEAAYLEILRFLIEQEGITCISVASKPDADACWSDLAQDFQIQLRGDCLRELFSCHGNETCPERAFSGAEKKEDAEYSASFTAIEGLLGENSSTAAHVAIGGEICGSARLFTGEEVPTINPSMRTSATWNTLAMVEAAGVPSDDEAALLIKVASALYDRVKNDGTSAEDRAINFSATAFIDTFPQLVKNPLFARIAGEIQDLAFDNIIATKSDCQRWDTLRYDVELSLYDFKNQFRGRTIVRYLVDVSQVNPFLDVRQVRILTKR